MKWAPASLVETEQDPWPGLLAFFFSPYVRTSYVPAKTVQELMQVLKKTGGVRGVNIPTKTPPHQPGYRGTELLRTKAPKFFPGLCIIGVQRKAQGRKSKPRNPILAFPPPCLNPEPKIPAGKPFRNVTQWGNRLEREDDKKLGETQKVTNFSKKIRRPPANETAEKKARRLFRGGRRENVNKPYYKSTRLLRNETIRASYVLHEPKHAGESRRSTKKRLKE